MTESLGVSGVHHLAIQVQDLDRSLAFYRDLLGLEEAKRQEHSVWLRLGDSLLMLELATSRDLPGTAKGAALAVEGAASPGGARETSSDPVSNPPVSWESGETGLFLLALRIDRADRQWWRQRLEAGGRSVERETGFTLYTRCPDGVRLGLSHHPDPIESEWRESGG